VTAPSAALALVLHAHLPWVRHDDHDALEERWLFEAITECYLPLLAVCDGLGRDGVPGSLALSLSPTLLAMLRDAALRARFEKHFAKLSATLNAAQRRLDARFRPALGHHARRLDAAWAMWTRLHGDLPAAFDAHRRTGRLSLWTSAAPHPLLPLWADRRWFLDLALDRAISLHRNVFGDSPAGLWLPECAVAPGVPEALAAHGVKVSVLETHGVLHAAPRPTRGIAWPVRDPSGVVFAGRDPHAATAVWSREVGYPGAPPYQDFASDLGHGPWEDFTAPDGTPLRTGLGPRSLEGEGTPRRHPRRAPVDHDALALSLERKRRPALSSLRRAQIAALRHRGGVVPPAAPRASRRRLTAAEAKRVAHEHRHETVVRVANGRVPVIAGTGTNATAETIARTRAARSSGPTPRWW
jgi:1,4-alpha-glucan branching enzyme